MIVGFLWLSRRAYQSTVWPRRARQPRRTQRALFTKNAAQQPFALAAQHGQEHARPRL